MSEDIIDYAADGNIEGVKEQVAAGVSINFQDNVSYRFSLYYFFLSILLIRSVLPVCLAVYPLTSFCLTYSVDPHI
jgi:hypothetical protein